MTMLVTPSSATEADDGPAIAELHRLHAVQRAAFQADPYPAAAERQAHLGALAGMVMGHRDEIRAARREDFGAHPDLFTDLVEVLGVAGTTASKGSASSPTPAASSFAGPATWPTRSCRPTAPWRRLS